MGDAPKRLSALVSQLSVNDAESTGVAMEPTATKCVDSPVLSKLNAIERYKFVTGDEPLIKGLWPAFITPFTKAGEVDVAAVAPLCDYLIDVCKVDGIYAVGGTGEMRSIGLEARKVMCDATCKAVAGRVPVVVCVGETENIEDGVMLAEHAKSCGADGLSATVPKFDAGSLDATVALYTALGEVGLPFYAYWIAPELGGNMGTWGPQEYLDAMAPVPNFAGLKFTDFGFHTFQNLMSRAGYKLNIVSGPDEMMLAGKIMGAHGAIGTTYNLMPKMNVAMSELYFAGEIVAAQDLMQKCNRVIEILTGAAAECPRDRTKTLAAMKFLMRELQGLTAGYVHPATSEELTGQEEADILAAVAALGFTPE